MQVVYEPKGAAAEYGPLAINPWGNHEGKWGGCSHGCLYCYCGLLPGQKAEWYRQPPRPKRGLLGKLHRDCERLLRERDGRRIVVQFLGDPYCPEERDWWQTREVLAILREYERPFATLTKGGTRAVCDFESYGDLGWFGTSLVWDREASRQHWEPGAAPIADRLEAIAVARAQGIRCWASVEPVIDQEEALAAIQTLLVLGVEDIRVGKIEHHPEWDSTPEEWEAFGRNLLGIMRDAPEVDWMVKRSLRAYMPGEWREAHNEH